MVFDFDCTLSKKHLFAFTNNWQITSMSRYQNVYNYYTFMKHINTHLSKDDLFAKLEINSNLYWKQGNMDDFVIIDQQTGKPPSYKLKNLKTYQDLPFFKGRDLWNYLLSDNERFDTFGKFIMGENGVEMLHDFLSKTKQEFQDKIDFHIVSNGIIDILFIFLGALDRTRELISNFSSITCKSAIDNKSTSNYFIASAPYKTSVIPISSIFNQEYNKTVRLSEIRIQTQKQENYIFFIDDTVKNYETAQEKKLPNVFYFEDYLEDNGEGIINEPMIINVNNWIRSIKNKIAIDKIPRCTDLSFIYDIEFITSYFPIGSNIKYNDTTIKDENINIEKVITGKVLKILDYGPSIIIEIDKPKDSQLTSTIEKRTVYDISNLVSVLTEDERKKLPFSINQSVNWKPQEGSVEPKSGTITWVGRKKTEKISDKLYYGICLDGAPADTGISKCNFYFNCNKKKKDYGVITEVKSDNVSKKDEETLSNKDDEETFGGFVESDASAGGYRKSKKKYRRKYRKHSIIHKIKGTKMKKTKRKLYKHKFKFKSKKEKLF